MEKRDAMTTSDLVKQMCQEEGMSIAVLAKELGQSRQNFYKKLQRDKAAPTRPLARWAKGDMPLYTWVMERAPLA